MALIPLTYKLDWYNPSEPGGTISTINNNANTATSSGTQYSMQDIIDTVSVAGAIPWPYQYDALDNLIQGVNPGATGSNNTALGIGAGASLAVGGNNVFIGAEAASQTVVDLNGADNVVIGYNAGNNMQGAASSNVWIGRGAARLVTAGQNSVIIGYLAGTDITGDTTGSTIVGNLAGPTARSYSTLIGHRSGYNITSSGEDNVCLGAYAGDAITDGDLNIMIGYASDPGSNTDNNSIAIGANATGAGSNTVVLGDTNITSWQPGADDTVSLGDKPTRGFKELILVSPDGTRWSVTVDNAGNLVVA